MARAKKKENLQPDTPDKLPVVMGAPTKFRIEYTDMLLHHFAVEPYYQSVAEQSLEYFANGKPKKASEKFRLVPNKLPTLFNFARSIGVAYSTVWRWAERGDDPELIARLDDHIAGKTIMHPEEFAKINGLKDFCNAYKDAKEMQKEFLVNLGLAGAAPPSSFIFVAKNVTDMKDEKKHTLSAPDGGPVQINVTELSDDELQNLARGGDARTSA